ncbi:hypothetical protein KSS87_017815 [Heliosperma pusillum]|nr:hypothetical protein KSS87_017815 [Heliosperma pusillum]
MVETIQYAFASPELHWLNNYLGSSHAFKRNALTQNLLSVPANQDNGNPNLVAAGTSSKSSPHLSRRTSPNGKGTNVEKKLLTSILSASYVSASATVVAPIERVYMLMQCQNEMIKSGRLSTPYKGMSDCFLRTIKHEGVISLWRGNSVNVISLYLQRAVPVAVYARLPYMDNMITKMKESPLWILPLFVTPVICRYPFEYAQVRLANDVKTVGKSKSFTLDLSRNTIGKRQFNGLIDVYKKTLQLDGIHGIYRGVSVSCIGLWTHYYMKEKISPLPSKEKRIIPSILGLGMLYSLKIGLYPIDTVRRRMMMTSGEASKYRGAKDAFYQIVKTEGVSSLFKGVTPFIIHNIAKDSAFVGFVLMTVLLLGKSLSDLQ